MKKIFLTIVISTITLIASAQDFAVVNPNSRTAAMGDATVSATADAYSIYNNAAAPLFEYQSVQAAYTYTSLNSKHFNEGLMALAGYVKIGQRHSIAFGGRLFNEPMYATDGEYPFLPTDENGNVDINDLNGEEMEGQEGKEDMIFDLNGRRISEPVKGFIYIINGQKVLY